MGIFATPDQKTTSDVKVLFLHGLEGSPEGEKSTHLKEKWDAKSPVLRSSHLRALRAQYPETDWAKMPKEEFNKAFSLVYSDALEAVRYQKPDVIVGSSMGGALLAKLIIEEKWSGAPVFLAPAIKPLLGDVVLPEMRNSVWILAELDDVVPNSDNIIHSSLSNGNLIISMNDNHRLHYALKNDLIDCAIVTALSFS